MLLAPFNFEGIAGRIDVPIAIARGENDDIIRLAAARRLAHDVASEDEKLEVVSGARHNLDSEVLRLVDWMCNRLTAGREGEA